MKKKFLLLCLAVLCGAIGANAADYKLYIAGTQVTDANKNSLPCSSGSAKYDPATNTLTLQSATINGNGTNSCIENLMTSGNLKVKVEGTCNLKANASNNCVYTKSNIEFIGDGTLNMTSESTGWSGICAYAAYNEITFNGPTTTINTIASCIAGQVVDYAPRVYVQASTLRMKSTDSYVTSNLGNFTTSGVTSSVSGIKMDNSLHSLVDGNGIRVKSVDFTLVTYSLKVNSKYITARNASDILGDGKMQFNSSGNTLYLDNVNYTTNSGTTMFWDSTDKFRIQVKGNCTLKNTGTANVIGSKGPLTIEGYNSSAVLNIEGNTGSNTSYDYKPIGTDYGAKIEVTGLTLKITDTKSGIGAIDKNKPCEVVMKDCKYNFILSVTDAKNAAFTDIKALTLENSTVTANTQCINPHNSAVINIVGSNTLESHYNNIYTANDLTIQGTNPSTDKLTAKVTSSSGYSSIFTDGTTLLKNLDIDFTGSSRGIASMTVSKAALTLDNVTGIIKGVNGAIDNMKSITLSGGTNIKTPSGASIKNGGIYASNGMIATTVEFGEEKYGVYVRGTQITSANINSLPTGLSYDPASNTLRMENYTASNSSSCIYYTGGVSVFNVEVKGTCSLTSSNNQALNSHTMLTIIGIGDNASLTATSNATNYDSYAYMPIGTDNGGMITISNLKVTTNSKRYGIGSVDYNKHVDVSLVSSDITCNVTESDPKYAGLYNIRNLQLTDSKVNVVLGSTSYSSGLYSDVNTTVKVKGQDNKFIVKNGLSPVAFYTGNNTATLQFVGTSSDPEANVLDIESRYTCVGTNKDDASITARNVTLNCKSNSYAVQGYTGSAKLTLDNMFGTFTGNTSALRNISALTMQNGTKILSGGSFSSSEKTVMDGSAASKKVVFGKTVNYNITFMGTAINNVNAADVLGEGSVSYDAATSTLTIKEGTYNGELRNNSTNDVTVLIDGRVVMKGGMLHFGNATVKGKTAGSSLDITANGTAGLYCDHQLTLSDLRLRVVSETATGLCGKAGSGSKLILGNNLSIVARGVTASLGKFDYLEDNGGYTYSPLNVRFDDAIGLGFKGFVDLNSKPIIYDVVIGKAEPVSVGNMYIYKGYNDADVLGDGKVKYDIASNTLQLDNATITNHGANAAVGYYGTESNFTIKVSGMNTIDNSSVTENGITAEKAITIKGNGMGDMLMVKSKTLDEYGKAIATWDGGKILVERCVLETYDPHSGIGSIGSKLAEVTFKNTFYNAYITADEPNKPQYAALHNVETINIDHAEVIVQQGKNQTSAVYANDNLIVRVLGGDENIICSKAGDKANAIVLDGNDAKALNIIGSNMNNALLIDGEVNGIYVPGKDKTININNIDLNVRGVNAAGIAGDNAYVLSILDSKGSLSGGQQAVVNAKPVVLNNVDITSPAGVTYDSAAGKYTLGGADVATVNFGPHTATVYDLKVKGTSVTSDNAGNILGDGTMSYDAAQKVLTMNNVFNDDYYGATRLFVESNIDGLFVEVIGNNSVKAGMKFNENTVMLGTGALSINQSLHDGDAALYAEKTLYVKNITLKAHGSNVGMRGPGAVHFVNATVSIKGAFANVMNLADLTLTDCGYELPSDGLYNISEMRMDDFNGDAYSGEIKIRPFTAYNLYIIGNKVTDLNCNDILHDGGKVMYDHATKTLTVTDFQETIEWPFLEAYDDITLVARGNNELGASKLVFSADATITGDGKLTVTSAAEAISMNNAKLTITDANLRIAGADGIVGTGANAMMVINNSNVEISTTGKAITGFLDCDNVGCATTKNSYYCFDDDVLKNAQGEVMSNAVFAPATTYTAGFHNVEKNIFINLNSLNAADLLEDGSVSVDLPTETFTINNCNRPEIALDNLNKLNLNVNGTNYLAGISGGDIDVKGDGTLNINDNVSGNWGVLFIDALDIKDVTLNVQSVGRAISSISSYGVVSIKGNAHVTAQGNAGSILEIGGLILDGVVMVQPQSAIYDPSLHGVAVGGSLTTETVKIIPESENDGIEEITADGADSKAYDITGRPVNTNSYRHGIIIRNGKKVAVK